MISEKASVSHSSSLSWSVLCPNWLLIFCTNEESCMKNCSNVSSLRAALLSQLDRFTVLQQFFYIHIKCKYSLRALWATQPCPLCLKSCKARLTYFKWFKVCFVGVSSTINLSCLSQVSAVFYDPPCCPDKVWGEVKCFIKQQDHNPSAIHRV